MVNGTHSSKRSKHIDIKHHLIRDAVDEGKVRVTYVKTENIHTNALTKSLDRMMCEQYVNALMNVS